MSDAVGFDESTVFETPLLDLAADVPPTVYGKAEWFNLPDAPYGGGSVKSRIAKGVLDGAERRGDLGPGMTVIEPSSGNTGSEVARLATARGHDVEIVVPDNAAGGKVEAIRAVGAEIHFVDADRGYDAVIERCEDLVAADLDRSTARTVRAPRQSRHPRAHDRPREPRPDRRRRHGRRVRTGRGPPRHRRLKYLRAGDHYHPGTYDESVLDRKAYAATAAAYERARALRDRFADREVPVVDPGRHDRATVREHLRVDGEFVGGTSSGAALPVVRDLADEGVLGPDDVAVVMLCDRGDRYADIPLWADDLDPAQLDRSPGTSSWTRSVRRGSRPSSTPKGSSSGPRDWYRRSSSPSPRRGSGHLDW